MDEKMKNNDQELEIDLQRLINALLNKAWLIAIAAVVLLHRWKGNVLLSIAGGTALYMLLVQGIFA